MGWDGRIFCEAALDGTGWDQGAFVEAACARERVLLERSSEHDAIAQGEQPHRHHEVEGGNDPVAEQCVLRREVVPDDILYLGCSFHSRRGEAQAAKGGQAALQLKQGGCQAAGTFFLSAAQPAARPAARSPSAKYLTSQLGVFSV